MKGVAYVVIEGSHIVLLTKIILACGSFGGISLVTYPIRGDQLSYWVTTAQRKCIRKDNKLL